MSINNEQNIKIDVDEQLNLSFISNIVENNFLEANQNLNSYSFQPLDYSSSTLEDTPILRQNLIEQIQTKQTLLTQRNNILAQLQQKYYHQTDLNYLLQSEKDTVLAKTPNNTVSTVLPAKVMPQQQQFVKLNAEVVSPTYSDLVHSPTQSDLNRSDTDINPISEINGVLLASMHLTPSTKGRTEGTITPSPTPNRIAFDESWFADHHDHHHHEELPVIPFSLKDFDVDDQVEKLAINTISFNPHQVMQVLKPICQTKKGSKLIQEQISSLGKLEFDSLQNQLMPDMLELCKDANSQHVVLKIVEEREFQWKERIVAVWEHNIMELALNLQSSKLIQRAMDALNLELRQRLSSALFSLEPKALSTLLRDMHANRLMQKMIERGMLEEIAHKRQYSQMYSQEFTVLMQKLNPLLEAMAGVKWLAMDQTGCRVVQKLVECIPEEQIYECVYFPLMQHVVELAQDKFGNQVVQHILLHSSGSASAKVVHALSRHLFLLSRQKFSSNVVQLALDLNNYRKGLIDALIELPLKQLAVLMNDMQGNYVVQTALKCSTAKQRKDWAKLAGQLREDLRRSRQGKFILRIIEESQKGKDL